MNLQTVLSLKMTRFRCICGYDKVSKLAMQLWRLCRTTNHCQINYCMNIPRFQNYFKTKVNQGPEIQRGQISLKNPSVNQIICKNLSKSSFAIILKSQRNTVISSPILLNMLHGKRTTCVLNYVDASRMGRQLKIYRFFYTSAHSKY